MGGSSMGGSSMGGSMGGSSTGEAWAEAARAEAAWAEEAWEHHGWKKHGSGMGISPFTQLASFLILDACNSILHTHQKQRRPQRSQRKQPSSASGEWGIAVIAD